jgi:hypothetical protein
MSTLAEFKRAERELAIRVRAFQEMKQSPEVQKAIAFEKALDDFLAVHKISRSALYELLAIEFEGDKKPAKKSHHKKPATAVQTSATKPAIKRAPKKRVFNGVKIRTFRNPHTGEELVVRGNRDGKFNAWNAQYGKDVVRGWKIDEVDAPPKSANA